MVQRVSKLDASRILEVSPSTIDRRIDRGELKIEHETRGNSYKVWVLLDDPADDAAHDGPAAGPGGEVAAEVPGIAGVADAPSNSSAESTEVRLLKQENQHLKELAELRKEALNESETRFRELLEGFNASQRTVETLTRALNPGAVGEDTGVAKNGHRRWWKSIFR